MTTPDPSKAAENWTAEDSVSMYRIDRWGEGYYSVNRGGHLTVRSVPNQDPEVSIIEVLEAAKASGLPPPLLIRFQDILRHRVDTLNKAFNEAIAEHGYEGSYRSVYPIKVNQLREVLEGILDAGEPYRAGLETGSKAEIFAALATLEGEGRIIVCNGYKDVDILKEAGLASCLQLVHFHIGSQIPDILTIKSAVREASRFYAKLQKLGYDVRYLDVGGGLAIDYDGSRSPSPSSMNYTLEEYARDVVYNIMDICQAEQVPQPSILSESGRALVAHHSVLVVQVFGADRNKPDLMIEKLPDTEHKLVTDLFEILQNLEADNLIESWHDVVQIKQEAQKLFEVGLLELPAKASIEVLRWNISKRIEEQLLQQQDDERPYELTEFDQELAEQHICNFSVFQSLLDHWALGQLFPIVPLQYLDRCPESHGTLVDITCDSDGKISEFIGSAGTVPAMPIHTFGDTPYYLGVFLTGAYQDIMGDIHNLFGRVSEAHVFLDAEKESGFCISERIDGARIGDVLSLTQYETSALIRQIKKQVDYSVKIGRLRPKEGIQLLADYRRGLADHTYLEF